jgi:hypothetical protein
MVQCRMNTLSDWIKEKNKFDGVSMVRLIHNRQAHDYTKWKFSGQNIFFFENDMKIGHILWITENITVIDENRIIINEDNEKYTCALTIYYGGAIL